MPIQDLTKHQCERDGEDYEQQKFLKETCVQNIYVDKKLQRKYKKLFPINKEILKWFNYIRS